MTKRRKRRRRRRYSRIRRRVKKAKIPIEVVGAGIAIPFTPAKDGWAPPIAEVQAQNWEGLGKNLSMGFAGFANGEPFDAFKMINPFDFSTARYTKMLIWAGIASKIRKRFVRIPFDRVPMIGKYIS